MSKDHPNSDGYLTGQILIAMPTMSDDRFARSVVYLCAHTDEGAMGLILNQEAPNIKFGELVDQLDLLDDTPQLISDVAEIPVHLGGPVESRRGFVLHSSEFYIEENTLEIEQGVSLTATTDILKAMAVGQGPEQALLALGYAGWAPGQLENEIQSNGWLSCKSDSDLIFFADLDDKYDLALKSLGIDPSFLVSEAGHA